MMLQKLRMMMKSMRRIAFSVIVLAIGTSSSLAGEINACKIEAAVLKGKIVSGVVWDGTSLLSSNDSKDGSIVDFNSLRIIKEQDIHGNVVFRCASAIHRYTKETWYTNAIVFAENIQYQKEGKLSYVMSENNVKDWLIRLGMPISEHMLGINLMPAHQVEMVSEPITFEDNMRYPSGWLTANLFLSNATNEEGFVVIHYRDTFGKQSYIAIVSFSANMNKVSIAHRFDLKGHVHPYFDMARNLCIFIVKGAHSKLMTFELLNLCGSSANEGRGIRQHVQDREEDD